MPNFPGLSKEVELVADKIKRIHEEVVSHLQLSNEKYKDATNSKRRFKEYNEGDLVIVFLRKSILTINSITRRLGPVRFYKRSMTMPSLSSYHQTSKSLQPSIFLNTIHEMNFN